MFHDDQLQSDEKGRYHEAYAKMAGAVDASLESYLWALDQLFAIFAKSPKDTHVAPTVLLMDYADVIDGVSILARAGAARSCVPLIRSGFELKLNLLYMLERDDVFEDRCLAYEFFHAQRRLKVASKYDPTTSAGKQIRGQSKGEPFADLLDGSTVDLAAEIKAAKEVVESPRYAAVKTEYERTKPKHWYSMWNGPRDIESLAKELKRHALYEVQYRYWSGDTHGEHALDRLMGMGGTAPGMRPLRSPQGLPMACMDACSLANEMAHFLMTRFFPTLKDELAARYLARIKSGMDYLRVVRFEE